MYLYLGAMDEFLKWSQPMAQQRRRSCCSAMESQRRHDIVWLISMHSAKLPSAACLQYVHTYIHLVKGKDDFNALQSL